MTKFGLMPLSQEAIGMLPTMAYHPFEGTANDMGEQQRLQRNIGPTKKILMLDNHGPLTLGKSIDEAFYLMYNVCRAASYQQKALAAVGGDVEKLYVPEQAALAAMKTFVDTVLLLSKEDCEDLNKVELKKYPKSNKKQLEASAADSMDGSA